MAGTASLAGLGALMTGMTLSAPPSPSDTGPIQAYGSAGGLPSVQVPQGPLQLSGATPDQASRDARDDIPFASPQITPLLPNDADSSGTGYDDYDAPPPALPYDSYGPYDSDDPYEADKPYGNPDLDLGLDPLPLFPLAPSADEPGATDQPPPDQHYPSAGPPPATSTPPPSHPPMTPTPSPTPSTPSSDGHTPPPPPTTPPPSAGPTTGGPTPGTPTQTPPPSPGTPTDTPPPSSGPGDDGLPFNPDLDGISVELNIPIFELTPKTPSAV